MSDEQNPLSGYSEEFGRPLTFDQPSDALGNPEVGGLDAATSEPNISFEQEILQRLRGQEIGRTSEVFDNNIAALEILNDYAASKINGEDAVAALGMTADLALRNNYVAGLENYFPSMLESAVTIAIAESKKPQKQPANSEYIRILTERLVQEPQTEAYEERPDSFGQTASIIFDVVSKFASGTIDAEEATRILTQVGAHALKNHYVAGIEIMYPLIHKTSAAIATAK